MTKIKSVVIDHSRPSHLRLGETHLPVPQPHQALVKVEAISLNPGELGGAASRAEGVQIGWDLAGTVLEPAADGGGPKTGSRVVGLIVTGGWGNDAPTIGAWAEQVAVPTVQLAEIPANVTFAQAATLPIAGLTALRGLEKNGAIWKKRVLITAANGAAGSFGVQIAHAAGAYVVGTVRRPETAAFVQENGANEVVVGSDLITAAAQYGPYDLILDSVGGDTLGEALTMLATDGMAVTIGVTGSAQLTFSPVKMFQAGGTSLYALSLFNELRYRPASTDLARLAGAVSTGEIKPHIQVEESWEKIEEIVQKILDHTINGKVVLHL